MKHEKVRRTGSDLLTSHSDLLTGHVEDKAANDDHFETDLEKDSAVYFERRRKIWAKFDQGDWWIAVSVYLIFSSVAFMVL